MFTPAQIFDAYEALSPTDKAEVLALITSKQALETVYSEDTNSVKVSLLGVRSSSKLPNKVSAIKAIREATGYGLKESKGTVDSLPSIFEVNNLSTAIILKDKLVDAGYIVE